MDVKVRAFCDAVDGFAFLARLDMVEQARTLPDPRLVDGLQNGRAQKLEYTVELCWKALKAYLKQVEGIDESSPKKIIKASFRAELLSEDDYLLLLTALDDRNRLSHVYSDAVFMQILARLGDYATLFERIRDRLEMST